MLLVPHIELCVFIEFYGFIMVTSHHLELEALCPKLTSLWGMGGGLRVLGQTLCPNLHPFGTGVLFNPSDDLNSLE